MTSRNKNTTTQSVILAPPEPLATEIRRLREQYRASKR
jgi:hypothetical protein